MTVFNVNQIFISSFLKGLWNHPEVIYHILNNTETEIIQNNLAPFICHNFFCNHLSGNYLENNLLYIIAMMLRDEVDKLENVHQVENFLENTKCGYLLEELINVPDVQIFFNRVISKTVEKIERNYSFREIKFNVQDILKEFMKIKEDEKKKIRHKEEKNLDEHYKNIINRKLIDLSINYSKEDNDKKMRERNINFIKKYSPDITSKEIEEYKNKAIKEDKINLMEYFEELENKIENEDNEELYSNSTLMKNLLDTTFSPYLLSFYQNHFFEAISFIEQLIEDLINNILLLPKSIKYICKIISVLVRNKFKDITKNEENAFISKFIIEKILMPIFSSPSFNAIISDFVISGNTIKNIKVINFILKKLFSCKLFVNNEIEGDYTPFNWFFMENIEKVLDFFQKSTFINLPTFIEKYINRKLSLNYSYDFFNENKDQICAYKSICFNFKNLEYLIKGFEKCNDLLLNKGKKIDKIKRSYSRLKDELNAIKSIDEKIINNNIEILKVNNNTKDKKQQIEFENYYLFNEKEIEKKYQNLFEINNQIANFYIDITKSEDLSEKEKNIIKVKNYLSNSLGNYQLLNKSDFNVGTTSDTIKMLNEIKSYMSLPNFILNNNTVPYVWYIDSLLEYLQKIPDEYKENDFKKLFTELTKNLIESINSLDFEKLIQFRNKLKFIDKINNYYDIVEQSFNNILINEKIKNIAEDVFIPIEMTFKYDSKIKTFELAKTNIKEKSFEDNYIFEIPKKNFKIKIFKTIETFTRYFPNLAKYQLTQGINPIEIIKELSINDKINNYFQVIKENILKKEIIDKDNYEKLYQEKIKDYIMNKISAKIYPPEPDTRDNEIFKKSMSLSWVEPQMILEKDYVFDSLLPDIINEFNQIKIASTPYKKLNCLKIIINYTKSVIKLNEGEDKTAGADDIIPALNYVFIKAHPFKIYTDIEFIKIFSSEEDDSENYLSSFVSVYELVLNCTPEYLRIEPEEYKKKCLEVRVNKKIMK